MDSERDSRKRKVSLADFKFIPFHEAMVASDHTIIDVTEEEFWELIQEFQSKLGQRIDSIEKQLNDMKEKISLLRASLILLTRGWDGEICDVVTGLGIEVDRLDLDKTLVTIADAIERLYNNYKILESQRPPEPEQMLVATAYDILANLSMNLEFGISFQEITVLEYLSYKYAIKMKLDSLKQK